jgi:hypothetical protein
MTPARSRSAVSRPAMAVAALAASTLLLTACNAGISFDKKDDAANAQSAAPSAAPTSQAPVDLAKLDTGKYPLEPRPAFGRPDDDLILEVEGQRMAQYVLAPFEVDPDLTNTKMPTGVVAAKSGLGMILSKELADVPANDTLAYGFTSTASTAPESLRSGTDRSLNNAVFRYLSGPDAEAAAQQMAAAAVKDDNDKAISLPGLPDTHAVQSTSADGNSIMMAFTPIVKNPYQGFVSYQWYEVGKKDEAKQEATLIKAISEQKKLIEQFPAAPTKEEAKAKGIEGPTRPLMDQNKILIYALPYSDEELKKGGSSRNYKRAVYGPRGMAHFSSNPALTYEVLTDVGSTNNASERSTVYRADTPAGAHKILEAFEKDLLADGASKIDPPQGLPGAACTKTNFQGTVVYLCMVELGRYVAEVSGTDLKDVHQATSAQYVLLTKADQNAK